MQKIQLPNSPHCPKCKKLLDGVALPGMDPNNMTPMTPFPGCVNICCYCTQIMIFTADMGLAYPTQEELRTVKADRALWRKIMLYQAQVRHFWKAKRHRDN